MRFWIVISLVSLFTLNACRQDLPAFDDNTPFVLSTPPYAPTLSIPPDNPLIVAGVRLGEKLFFDNRLSRDLSISCASCHNPENAFSDQVAFSEGVGGKKGKRNAPTLMNIAYAPLFLWDGGSFSLEAQALVPIQSHREMNMTLTEIADRLKADPEYVRMFHATYANERYEAAILKSLASYQRTIQSFDSRFDDYFYRKKKNALSPSERNGLKLFMSEKTMCSHCHTPPLFTNFSFKNNGLSSDYIDSGRGRITQLPSDLGKFKVPTLRNISLTAPYMHDGSFASLGEVIEHYNKGGSMHPNKSPMIKALNLTAKEKANLIAFLNTLSDYRFSVK